MRSYCADKGQRIWEAITLPRETDVLNLFAVNLWTFIGALCFLFAAWLLPPEMAKQKTRLE